MRELSGRTAVVTGSSSGIGRAIAEHFAAAGANVVVNSRSAERAEAVAREINAAGGSGASGATDAADGDGTDSRADAPGADDDADDDVDEADVGGADDEAGRGSAIGVAADVTDEDAMAALVEATVEEFGGLDVWVNNAGITVTGPAETFGVENWRRVVDVDLVGTFIGCKVAGRQMIEQGDGGAILNVSSLMGRNGLHERSPYCAAKAGVDNLTRTLAVEWADHEIYVNALAPGYVETEITAQTRESAGYTAADVEDRTPLGRFGTPAEMARCAKFLVARDNFVTGEILTADGGWNAYAWGAGDQ